MPPQNKIAIVTTILAIAFISNATAEPNNDVVGYCRSTAPSYTAMATCIDAERKARNLQSCLDALAQWPKDVPCPTEWIQAAVRNIRENLPCQMNEVKG